MATPLSQNRDIVLRWYEGTHHQKSLAAIDELCEPEYGRDLKRWFEMFHAAFPDATYSVEDVIADGDKVVIRQRFQGAHQGDFDTPLGTIPPTGVGIETEDILIFQVAGGKLVRGWLGADWLRILQQLGVVKRL